MTSNKWHQPWMTTGITMSVIVDGEESDPTKVHSGMPKGTALGPPLFFLHLCIYLNDMRNVISIGTTYIQSFSNDCLTYLDIFSLMTRPTRGMRFKLHTTLQHKYAPSSIVGLVVSQSQKKWQTTKQSRVVSIQTIPRPSRFCPFFYSQYKMKQTLLAGL